MRFEINGIMAIGVAFKLRKSVLLSLEKNVTNARTWFKRPRKLLVDVFPQYFLSES